MAGFALRSASTAPTMVEVQRLFDDYTVEIDSVFDAPLRK